MTLVNLATALREAGRSSEAVALYREAEPLVRETLGESHPLQGQVLAGLASSGRSR